ncbi:MAG: SLBB domain-containing protein [Rhodospirillales bacterium]|nr:SLBB domain-containing protein [Alphaproteobacteria bacterium]MCB9986299.1 SLBB domain-containing protein [Rhodospirillales bacterium]USO07148.1 MAG: SLBB domain-containing protein [Rhodospirillales bacterium]
MYLAAFAAQVNYVGAQEAADSASQAETQDMSLADIDAALPAHLRQPLPLDAPAQGTPANARMSELAPDLALDSALPVVTPPRGAPASQLEQFYRAASGDPTLRQFGYDFLAATPKGTPANGAVQDDYVLGAGDRLTIAFLGERKDRESYTIDKTGTLNIDLLPPMAAAGKTLGELRADLIRLMQSESYHGDIYLSLEHVRQIGVLVAGGVARPGRQAVTPLQTVLEALEQSGGILKTGSLRAIKLIRDGNAETVDLYGVIAGRGSVKLPLLRDGDRIIVPPLGSTMAVTGDVRTPGIFELPDDEAPSVADALRLAGGPTARGQNRVVLQTPHGNGTRTSISISADSTDRAVGDGAIIAVNRTLDRSVGSFTLLGETRSPGTYPLAPYKKLSALLRRAEAFGDDVYPLMGVISRRKDSDLSRDLIAFSPQGIFTGRVDEPTKDGDEIRLLSRADVRTIMDGKQPDDLPPLVAGFVREHAVSLLGAVRTPGRWPVAGSISALRLVDVAGGANNDADLTRAEISRNDVGLMSASTSAISHRDVVDLSDPHDGGLTLRAGDALHIPDRFEAVTRQSVTIRGEVRNPGTYDLMRGDTLLVLIERAGGLTDQAYPLGTVFSRATERRREKEKFSIAAHDLERSIALAANNDTGKVDMAQMALAKDLVNELKTIEPVGRITVESDPEILRRDPAQDILLEADDIIYVPKRPLSVRVTGEVLSPAALQFRSDKKFRDYITEAGGTTMNADEGRIFVLYPNGSARPVSGRTWTRVNPLMVTPGSTIVVPRDPKPFDFIESAKDITQILSNLAVSGIYANDLIDRTH